MPFQSMAYTLLNSQSLLVFVNFGSGNEKFKDLGERHGLPLQLTCKNFPKQVPRFSCVSKTYKCIVRIIESYIQLGVQDLCGLL